MANGEVRVFLTDTGRGTVAAATNQSPYFCFEGATEAVVLETARRALAFYDQHRFDVVRITRPVTEIRPFRPTRSVSSKELMGLAVA